MLLTRPTDGDVLWFEEDVTSLPEKELAKRRRDVQIVFQDPLASLNPRLTIEQIIREPISSLCPDWGEEKVASEIKNVLVRVGLQPEMALRYPHELSGGQCQRVSIARAIIVKPKIIVLDEPVSALDVLVQAQIINLLKDLQKEFGLSYLFIGHDLSVVRYISDRIIVMYLGKVMEAGERVELFANPKHPYTKALLSAVPVADPNEQTHRRSVKLDGELPSPLNPPSGCRFHTRCEHASSICEKVDPASETVATNHAVACHHWREIGDQAAS